MKKEYSTGEVTVVWKPDVCIHAAECANGLPKVFNPDQKPWIQLEHATAEEIRSTVRKCPSGALSIRKEEESVASATEINVTVNGPLLIDGEVRVKDPNGKILKEATKMALCRCGASSNKPFCDGAHSKINFVG